MKKTRLRVTICGASLSLVALLLGFRAADAETIEIRTDNARFAINTDTLAISGSRDSDESVEIGKPAVLQGKTTAFSRIEDGATWTLTTDEAVFSLAALADGDDLILEVKADRPTAIAWPRSVPGASVEAYALPILGEGRYIPAADDEWTQFLAEQFASGPLIETLSLPFWTVLYPDASLTWTVETPFGAELELDDVDGRLSVGLMQEFSPLDYQSEYRIRLTFDEADPVAGARLYREHLKATHQRYFLKQYQFRRLFSA